eukprot:359540-Chlamydomonas_euryale.AAC.5
MERPATHPAAPFAPRCDVTPADPACSVRLPQETPRRAIAWPDARCDMHSGADAASSCGRRLDAVSFRGVKAGHGGAPAAARAVEPLAEHRVVRSDPRRSRRAVAGRHSVAWRAGARRSQQPPLSTSHCFLEE